MAYYICGKPCELLCEGCNFCFGQCSKAFGECCNQLGQACQALARCGCVDCARDMCCHPQRLTPFYLTWGVVMGGCLVGLAAASAADDPGNCQKDLMVWCIICVILGLIHGLYAVYCYFLFVKIGMEQQEKDAEAGIEDGGMNRVNLHDKAYDIFMMDPWTAVYILLYIFSFVWGIMGIVWTGDEKGCTGSDLKSTTESLAILLIVYGVVTPLVILFGLCFNAIRIKAQNSAKGVDDGSADPCAKCCWYPVTDGAICPVQMCCCICCCPCYCMGKCLLVKGGQGTANQFNNGDLSGITNASNTSSWKAEIPPGQHQGSTIEPPPPMNKVHGQAPVTASNTNYA